MFVNCHVTSSGGVITRIFDGDEIIKEAHIKQVIGAHDIHQTCSKIIAAPKVLVFSTTGYFA